MNLLNLISVSIVKRQIQNSELFSRETESTTNKSFFNSNKTWMLFWLDWNKELFFQTFRAASKFWTHCAGQFPIIIYCCHLPQNLMKESTIKPGGALFSWLLLPNKKHETNARWTYENVSPYIKQTGFGSVLLFSVASNSARLFHQSRMTVNALNIDQQIQNEEIS